MADNQDRRMSNNNLSSVAAFAAAAVADLSSSIGEIDSSIMPSKPTKSKSLEQNTPPPALSSILTPPSSVPPSPAQSPSHTGRKPVIRPKPKTVFRSSTDSSATSVDTKDVETMPLMTPIPSKSSILGEEEKAAMSDHPLDKMLRLENPPQPTPNHPSKCPLFCCFYAEFDIKVGPVIRFQSPQNFMNQDINISVEKIHDILGKTFDGFNEKKHPISEAGGACEPVQEGSATKEEGRKTPAKPRDFSSQSTLPEDEQVKLPEGSLSIFDSTSEYIITGNELTGKSINLSTHDMHIMTRPTIIADERYARNALLFSVGFVLRRAADPRPFRPLLSKLALTLRSMEVESQFLSKPALRKEVQPLLERILVSLNSSQWECNLILSQSNSLNLKLFHPPKAEVAPVHDHEVPILLRRDLQLQMYDWDLAINWVILHIDGVTNARLISIKAEVDLEMVRACLRVLHHHGVIALVDMFMYSNRYEFTDRATAMLAGKEPKLLQEAVEFAMKRTSLNMSQGLSSTVAPMFSSGATGGVGSGSDSSPLQHSPSLFQHPPSTSYPPPTMSLIGGSHKSSNFKFAMMAAKSLEKDPMSTPHREEQRCLKGAISELFCACHRNISFGELWISLTSDVPNPLAMPNLPRVPAQRTTTHTLHRKTSATRKGSITEEVTFDKEQYREHMNSLALSPLETNNLEALRKPSSGSAIDWNDAFNRFDHRRFAAFGLVHGLLARVHNYPLFPGHFPETNIVFEDRANSSESRRFPRSDFPEERAYELARQIASLMDGTRCDDELVCMFEKSFTQIVELVEKYGGRKIVSVYATHWGSS